MIGRIRGAVLECQPPHIVIDVNGLGYELEIPLSALNELPAVGNVSELYTHFVVREDAQLLYGFVTRKERDLFRQLIRISGVGPKLGLSVLSHVNAEELVRCVREDNLDRLTKVPGIGRKTAQRLLIELRDRLRHWQANTELVASALAGEKAADLADPCAEAEQALMALGYKATEATRAVQQVYQAGMARDTLIRQVLKGMVKA